MASLDPILAAALPTLEAVLAGSGEPLSAETLRLQVDRLLAAVRVAEPEPFDGEIRDEQVSTDAGPVPVRLYEPTSAEGDVIVFFHGGGWVVGNRDSADVTARALALRLISTVVSVDYRLAPEHPFPAAHDDCLAVVKAMVADRRPTWLGVAGDSAGGNLAAAVSLVAPDHGLHIDGQLLICPVLDSGMDSRSYRDFADGYLLTADAMRYYWDSYAGTADRSDPALSLSHAEDLSRLPATVITTAGFDPLRDEGDRFAARLVSSGVPTVYLPAPTLTHGWLDTGDLVPAARAARDEAFDAFDVLRNHARRRTPPLAV